VPQIEVTFDIDANGIVHVSAKDRGTGKEQSMTITGGSALSKEDIDKMVRDAEQYADEDRQRREQVETRNQADSLVYSTEKFLADNSDKIDDALRTEVQNDVDTLKKALEGEDLEEVNRAMSTLGESSQKMGAAMYAASAEAAGSEAAAQGAAGDGAGADDGGDDVVDAEIVDETAGGTDEAAGEGEAR